MLVAWWVVEGQPVGTEEVRFYLQPFVFRVEMTGSNIGAQQGGRSVPAVGSESGVEVGALPDVFEGEWCIVAP